MESFKHIFALFYSDVISDALLTLAMRWRFNTASSLPECVGEVDVSLCNNGAVQCGKLANHL